MQIIHLKTLEWYGTLLPAFQVNYFDLKTDIIISKKPNSPSVNIQIIHFNMNLWESHFNRFKNDDNFLFKVINICQTKNYTKCIKLIYLNSVILI